MLKFSILIFFINFPLIFATKSYEGAQLLRFRDFNNGTALNILTNNYGGSIWKEENNKVDISFEKKYLDEVKDYIKSLRIEFEILMPNIQEIIDYSTSNITERKIGMTWTSYHKFKIIKNYIISLERKYPKLVKILRIGKSIQNRNLYVIRISANVSKNKAIWLEGGIHAREWISPASVTFIAHYLLTRWKSLPAKLKNKTWYIMPVMNPDGYVFSHNNDRLWRKNRRKFSNNSCVGVDLNRNFNIDWNSKKQSKNPCSFTYRGTKPFSEPESRAVKFFLNKNRKYIKAYVTYHSFSQRIAWAWSYTKTKIAPNALKMKKLGTKIASNIKASTGKNYIATRASKFLFVSGSVNDWVKKELKIPYTMIVELRDTGKYGFLLPPNQIIQTAKEALIAAKTTANAF